MRPPLLYNLLQRNTTAHTHTGVTVIISEQGVSYNPVTLAGTERTISLVMGQSYRLTCESIEGGFGSLTNVWFRDETPVGTTAPGSGVSGVYATNDGSNSRGLVIQMFDTGQAGTYSCRGTMNDRFTVTVGSGE